MDGILKEPVKTKIRKYLDDDLISMVICKSIYTAQNARVQRPAIVLGGPVPVFNEREAHDMETTTTKGAVKPWSLWVAEVENSALYEVSLQ
jgi:hypothetical protein